MENILILHGVNLNMFGKRDPKHYGSDTLDDINAGIKVEADALGAAVSFFQSNFEGAFVERIHAAHTDGTDGIVMNAGAWTHYSYAIAYALAILTIPVIEVHMSHVHARDAFRHITVFPQVTRGATSGFGRNRYVFGLRAALDIIRGA